jgi:glucan phosphoethanolaminetransferase (alkaline phosphatase superfamily)
LYLNAVGGVLGRAFGILEEPEKVRQRQRQSKPLPDLVPRAALPRNVVLILTESVRSDAVCNAFEEDCAKTPFTNALMPNRLPLQELRSVSSTTATSLAVVTSGLNATADSETMHTWPLLFDYARAAGFDTAYWTSQNLTFGNFALWAQHLGVKSLPASPMAASTRTARL